MSNIICSALEAVIDDYPIGYEDVYDIQNFAARARAELDALLKENQEQAATISTLRAALAMYQRQAALRQ